MMKTTLIFRLFLLTVSFLTFIPHTATADITKWGLPEDAIARFGKSKINEATYSPDGKFLAVASDIGIWLYDAHSGEELNLITGHAERIASVRFSPDGQTLATGSYDETMRLWDVQTGVEKQAFSGLYGINSVSFSPDGKTLASGDYGITVILWDVQTGDIKQRFKGNRSRINTVSFSPDGKTIANSGSNRDGIFLWDVQTGTLKQSLYGHSASYRLTGGVSSVSFSPDGRTLATGGLGGTVLLWRVTTEPAVVSMSPAAVASPAVGEQLQLRLKITGGVAVAGYQATVQFDTTPLRYVSSENGDYLPENTIFLEPIAEGNRIKLNAAALAGASNGHGILATLTFEVIAAKASMVTLFDIHLANSVGETFAAKVENTQINEPTGLAADANAQRKADVNGDGTVKSQI